jgi:hypothetical protein
MIFLIPDYLVGMTIDALTAIAVWVRSSRDSVRRQNNVYLDLRPRRIH